MLNLMRLILMKFWVIFRNKDRPDPKAGPD